MSFFDLISFIGIFVLIINTYFYFKSYLNYSIAFKVFSIYLFLTLLIQISSSVLFQLGINNLYLSHFYFISQFILLSFFYSSLEKKNSVKKGIKYILLIGLIFISIYYTKDPETYYKFNIFEIIVTSIPLIIYSFLFFLKRIDNEDKKFIYINSGLFLYLSCSTLLFVAGNIKSSLKEVLWYSNVSLYLVYQILIFIEWYKNFKSKKNIKNSTFIKHE
ncbi:hypothetical protein BTO14_14190 [Polaribacter butkevichii]|uniref:7TM-DISM receptor extracellular domain-containing protein n=1 Tax=Polaribacter butkevichii TaxID=218490 RepID=A0A2P6C8C3_9FLAO|nr:hypothetical protein BTO14_14190 [Polaribacter butkevichii]